MIKKLYYILFLFTLFLPVSGRTQDIADDKAFNKAIHDVMGRVDKKEKKDLVGEFKEVLGAIVPQLEKASEEDRQKPYYEDNLVSILKRLPPYIYQYIGPYLHTVPGMSERILNMPGIKETKGKIPTRIAPQMQDFAKKHLKYLHPRFYFLLMPEAWPDPKEKANNFEQQKHKYKWRIPANTGTLPRKRMTGIKDIMKRIPPEHFMQGKGKTEIKEEIKRSQNITENSPLEKGDVIAFMDTIEDIRKWGDNNKRKINNQIRHLGYRDNDVGVATGHFDMTGMMKDVTYPCAVIADRVKRLGYEDDFNQIIAKQKFNNIDEWAFTCDKTVKAYRVARMNWSVAFTLYDWRKRRGKLVTRKNLTTEEANKIKNLLDMYIKMYEAPETDRLAVRPYLDEIREHFLGSKGLLLSLPFYGIH